jgi:hypothetical protein
MSYGQWKVDEKATFEEFGYEIINLTYGSTKPVRCQCEACGISSIKRFRESNAKHICEPIIDGKKKCFKCKIFKPIEEFSKNRHTFDKYQKACKECFSNYECVQKGYKKKNDILKNDLKVYLRNVTSRIGRKSKDKNIPFDLEKEYLYNLFLAQNGKCYFTGLNMVHNIGCHQYDSISVDRLDAHKGYIKDNIVLSLFAINSFKGMMNESEFKKFLKNTIPQLIEYSNK